MKKIFLLIPVLALSLLVNATPVSVSPGTHTIYTAYSSATAGAILELEDGTYDETERLIFTKDITIKAKEGATVIVKPHKDNQIKEGAKVKFIGIKFDGSEMSTYEYFIRSYDATAGKELRFEGCELYGFAAQYLINAAGATRTLDSVIINDCKCINNSKDAIYIAAGSETQETAKGVIVKNSTFANFTSLSHSVIEVDNYNGTKTPNIEVTVDHCTFYNNPTSADGYAGIRVYKSTKVAISNCIFAHPEAYARCGTYCYGGIINNCLSYNLTLGTKGHRSTDIDVSTCLPNADPLFKDVANADFTLRAGSPARGAATDASDLGDPRWAGAISPIETDISSDLVLEPADAVRNEYFKLDNNIHLKSNNPDPATEYGIATWQIHVTREVATQIKLHINSDSEYGHTYKVEIINATTDEKAGESSESDWTDVKGEVAFLNVINLPEGYYTVKLSNICDGSVALLDDVTLSYAGGDVQNMPGTTNINDALFSSNGTREDGKITFPGSTIDDGWVKWNVNFASTGNFNVKVNINNIYGHNYTVALYKTEDDPHPIVANKGDDYTTTGSPNIVDLGSINVTTAGNYIMKVTNSIEGSDAALLSVKLTPDGGALVNLPNTLPLADVILSERALIDNDSILFTARGDEGYNSSNWAKWNVHSSGGWYKFTLNGYNSNPNNENGQQYTVTVLSSDETITKTTKTSAWAHPGASSCVTDVIELPEGNYVVKVQNPLWGSTGRVLSVVASYEGGAVVNIPNNDIPDIPFADAILNGGATRNLVNDPHEIHFGSVSANAQWNVHATAGLYTFTFDVVGTNYGIYKLDILDGSETIFTQENGQDKVGQVTISNAFIPADGDYVLQLANINSGADGYLTSLAATAATDVFVLDENTENDGSIAAAAGNTYTFLLKRSFEADRYYTICIPVGSWDSELKLAFGDDYELWKMTSATQSGDEIDLNFTQINGESFHAGWPYIIKPSVAVQNPIFYNKKEIKNSTYNNTQSFDAADFIGTFYKGKIDAGVNNLYLQNNDLYYSASNDTPIKGTRAWIRIKPAGAAGVRARIVLGGQSATAIDLVNGELVNGTVKTIENGQLIIIRDGVRYNVMGIRLQ